MSDESDAESKRECEPQNVVDLEIGGGTPAASNEPVLKHLPLHAITAPRNPRHTSLSAYAIPSAGASDFGDASIDLEGLARSLGSENEPRLAEPPVVEEMPDGSYRLCAGERRVEAARLAGWTGILCLVYPPMDPVRAHTLGLLENMHRLPMHPLEEISTLCISRLLANADARGMSKEARLLLQNAWEQGQSSYDIIRELEGMLKDSGWVPERPDVTWKAHLDDLGISMAPWERKRKLRLLNIEPGLQEQLRELDITEAALRSLGTLEPEDQKRVVEALAANPALARKVRRVARARRDGFYTSIEDALAEVQGFHDWPRSESETDAVSDLSSTGLGRTMIPFESISEPNSIQSPMASTALPIQVNSPTLQGPQVPTEVQDAVLQLLECADRLSSAMSTLEEYHGEPTLPEPWSTWLRDALDFIGKALPGRDNTLTHLAQPGK